MPRAPLVYAVGTVFGRLTVIAEPLSGGNRVGRLYRCRCSCGVEKLVRAYLLRVGQVKSCGCQRRETMRITAMAPKTPEQRAKISASVKERAAREKRLQVVFAKDEDLHPDDQRQRRLRCSDEAANDLATALGVAARRA